MPSTREQKAKAKRSTEADWMSDLEKLTVADMQSWYQRYYAPNNATLVVVGDVDADLERGHGENMENLHRRPHKVTVGTGRFL